MEAAHRDQSRLKEDTGLHLPSALHTEPTEPTEPTACPASA